MTPSKKDDQREPSDMNRHSLAAPESTLKSQVLQAARQAWADDDSLAEEISWHRPILGLAASITLAATLVFAANGPRQHSSGPDIPSATITLTAGSPRLSLAAACLPPRDAAQGVLMRMERLHAIIDPVDK